MYKPLIIFGIIICGYCYGLDWDNVDSGAKDRNRLQPIEYSLSLSDSIPIDTLEYKEDCFGCLDHTKRQEQELSMYGCYSPIIN